MVTETADRKDEKSSIMTVQGSMGGAESGHVYTLTTRWLRWCSITWKLRCRGLSFRK